MTLIELEAALQRAREKGARDDDFFNIAIGLTRMPAYAVWFNIAPDGTRFLVIHEGPAMENDV